MPEEVFLFETKQTEKNTSRDAEEKVSKTL